MEQNIRVGEDIDPEDLWTAVMTKGRSLERGATNNLLGPEIADVMERFEEAAFQVQVHSDLAVARYKLYDAAGMWLQSRAYLDEGTYRSVQVAARDYLAERIVPGYFARLRSDPFTQAPGLNLKSPNCVTRAFAQLPQRERVEAVAEFFRLSLRKADWIYSLQHGRFLAQENETGGYTLMLTEEY